MDEAGVGCISVEISFWKNYFGVHFFGGANLRWWPVSRDDYSLSNCPRVRENGFTIISS